MFAGSFPSRHTAKKQLSDVSVRLDELLRFITAPIRATLDSIDQRLSDSTEGIRGTYVTVRRQRALVRTLEERQLAEVSLTQQADVLRAGLAGLSDADRALLDRGPLFSRADQAVESWLEGLNTFREDAEGLHRTAASLLDGAEPPPVEPEGETLQQAFGEYRTILSDATVALEALINRSEAIVSVAESSDESNPWQRWVEKRREFKKAYDAAVQRSSAHRQQMDQLQAIEQQHQAHVRETTRVREELRALSAADTAHQTERMAWANLIDERNEALDKQCAKLTIQSVGAIRANVRQYADATDFVEGLKQAIAGSRVPGNKIEGLGASIANADTPEEARSRWKGILSDLEKLAEFDEERDGAEKRPGAPILTRAGLTDANLDGIGRRLSSDGWLTLSLTPIKGQPVFEYQAREHEYIPFRNASAGQQATALLKTLLNQSGPPLIIDQPEEDLDNPVMLEIVERVWEAKQKRQLIFASHNANLVVNGDAELIAWCDYRTAGDQSRGTIAGEGAIDVNLVRDAIKRIMEGGEVAFKLRKEKYGF